MNARPRSTGPRWRAVLVAAALIPGLALTAPAFAAPTDPSSSTSPNSVDIASGDVIPDSIVVKINSGHALSEVTDRYPVTMASALLKSRGIYLLRPVNASDSASTAAMSALAGRIAGSSAAAYAEPNYATTLNSDRYHSWPDGPPTKAPGGSGAWLDQPAADALDLTDAHAISTGVGIKVAVLDTGVDPNHPALRGRLIGGWDDIDDDSNPTDVAAGADSNGNGTVDDAYGHGTFVAGMLALVAPDARIMPYRVLDGDGVGNVFVVAEAILQASFAGAKVINISSGTDQATESKTLSDAISTAQQNGVIVVAAAGNQGSTQANYPAADTGVLSVSATDGAGLASWANRGSWVKVAAPGADVVGPVPGGVYADWSGTSMATPLVAGQVALLRSMDPSASPAEVIADITATSQPVTGTTSGAVSPVDSLYNLG